LLDHESEWGLGPTADWAVECPPPETGCPPFLIQPRLAEAYVPFQCLKEKYPPPEALMKGTLFPELLRPYVEGGRDEYA